MTIPTDEICQRLNAQMADGIHVFKCPPGGRRKSEQGNVSGGSS